VAERLWVNIKGDNLMLSVLEAMFSSYPTVLAEWKRWMCKWTVKQMTDSYSNSETAVGCKKKNILQSKYHGKN